MDKKLFAVLVLILGAISCCVGTAALAETFTGGFPENQPFASFWHPSTILLWNPATDPDAPYNRSSVPLQDRFIFPGSQVNDHARAGEGEVIALSIMNPSTSNNPSQGMPSFDVFAFNYWVLTDRTNNNGNILSCFC